MKLAKILMVEDQLDLAEPLQEGLQDEGYDVVLAPTAEWGRRHLEQSSWDLVILDLMLPDMPGESLLQFMKQRPDYPSVLILTAKSQIEDKLSLFRQGCDDYLTKPFVFDELLMRVKALLRRSKHVLQETCTYEDLVLDSTTYHLSVGDETVLLTPKEAAICRLLMSDPGRVVSRKEILNGVWGLKEEPLSNPLGVHVFHLRKKFAQLGRENWFQTLRSAGFVVKKPE